MNEKLGGHSRKTEAMYIKKQKQKTPEILELKKTVPQIKKFTRWD